MKNFYNIADFVYLQPFQNNIESIVQEYKDIGKIKKLPIFTYVKNEANVAVFESNNATESYWKTLPIFCGVNKEIEKQSVKLFPKTLEMIYTLQKHVTINAAQFCKLDGLSYFPRHKHDKDDFVIFHNLLFDLNNACVYESENEYKEVKNTKDYVIFPLSNMHSVYNFAKAPKISFSVSFKLD
ncbi:MAG: hypothetical protein EBU90_02510 [Proteobacteria bacterium]|nr:hypothetical protein [Pseudomonadota bacterium]NBP13108.1 hypothetical protein [bacterium]